MTKLEQKLEEAKSEWAEYNNGCFQSLEETLEFVTEVWNEAIKECEGKIKDWVTSENGLRNTVGNNALNDFLEYLEPTCYCYDHILLVGDAYWICRDCRKDLSLDISQMSEGTYNKIKKNIKVDLPKPDITSDKTDVWPRITN